MEASGRPVRRPVWLQGLRAIAWIVLSAIVLVTVLLVGAWVWTGSDDSLTVSISRAARYLPEGQTLETEDVKGSLRNGGHIGLLRWRGNGLLVEARDVEFGWHPFALANRKLSLDTLAIGQLLIDDQRTPTPAKPVDSFHLPLEVDVSFAVEDFQWKGPAPLAVKDLAGRYRYDGTRHSLVMENAGFAAGTYSASATLLADAPMTLEARLRGDVLAPVPGGPGGGAALPLQVVATASGPMAGVSATLDVQASVQPGTGTGTGTSTGATVIAPAQPMRATATARIMPWAAQPVVQGAATFSQLDLAALWPRAPVTALDGHVTLQPVSGVAAQWRAEGDIRNAASGPWDKHRLPVQSAQGQVLWSQGAWDIESLKAEVAGGQVQAQGRLLVAASSPAGSVTSSTTSATASTTAAAAKSGPQLTGWQVTAQLQGVNPAALHSQLAAAPLDGKLQAKAAGEAIEFDADLKPSARQPEKSRLRGLRIKEGSAKGRWADGRLSLQSLRLEAADALIIGRQIEVQIATRASSGQLDFSLPGAKGTVQGNMSAANGAGSFSVHASDAALAMRWLAQLPGMPAGLLGAALLGRADATGQWQGGWQNEGRNLDVQASLDVPQLSLRSAGQSEAQALQFRELKAEAKGKLSALTLSVSGRMESGTQRLGLQAAASGGRTPAGGWQGRVDSAQVQMQDSFRPGVWQVRLQTPLTLAWQGNALQTGAGEASLSGPAAGTATLAWEPLSWRSASGRSSLTTKGQLRGLPLAWIELLGNTQLANLGLSGSMLFDGNWDVQAGDTFRLQAGLQRRSGDLRVLANADPADAAGGVQINAGVKEASLRITSDASNLQVAARWDSENAGKVSADISTRVTRSGDSWTNWQWADDAPLSGTLRANLPRVGVWSVLAPPGWRMRGTLDLDATLAGTRHDPQWAGNLRADDLALRSVVEGIEFGGGKLRATLKGLRLTIDEFSLHGAPGGGGGTTTRVVNAATTAAAGGLLNITGFVAWQPASKPDASLVDKVRMELSAKAENLRVSSRADRRLVVSGALQARLVGKQVELRGTLRADQALIILPDESTPTLGDDVIVKSSVSRAGNAAAALPSGGVRILPDVAITLELGNDFRVQGRGLNTRLAGNVSLSTTVGAAAAPRLTGEVRTVAGTYRAYGQYLTIEEGLLRFTGSPENPSLDILAIRPNLSVRVGVQINGTALAPRVRLYSSPELPDAEKLAWLVLGRSAAAGGAESAVLQQAAMALLGGRSGGSGGIAQALGLDDISFRGSATASDGTTTSAALTLGKRLSRDFYVAYERSMAGTMGTFYIFYDLSKRFTLRAQTGEQSAFDLIFTLPYE
jgi:translocation and assembly module TamB